MIFILIVVSGFNPMIPRDISFTEFHSKIACDFALKESKKYFKTINDQSKCISMEELEKENNIKEEIKNLQKKLNE